MRAPRKVGSSRILVRGILDYDGTPMTLQGQRTSPFRDAYHYLANASWPAVLLFIATVFVAANAVFALGYRVLGGVVNARPGSFVDAFFFSVQTMATIGYGTMAPRSTLANLLVTIEALFGGLGLALMTGLVFAKFSRPTSRVRFSSVAVIGEYRGRRSLMLRMANQRDARIVQPQLYAVLLRSEPEPNGGYFVRVHDLELVRDRHAFLSLTWLVVHTIDERSPLYDATPGSLRHDRVAVVVSLTGIDEGLSQTLYAHHSYLAHEIRWNAGFADVIRPRDGGGWLVDYSRFDDVLDLPQPETTAGSVAGTEAR
jgi:inward rectifier potassium channel